MFVIVYGALRSGTTLLRLMLDMHPGLSCPDEADFLFDFADVAADGSVTIDREAMGRDRVYTDSAVTLSADLDGREAIADMIAQMHDTPGDCAVIMIHRGLETAMKLFPDTPVLHMLRDPRDVARSSIGMGWAGTVYHGAAHWIETEREWDRALAVHPGMVQADLRYEALIADPEAELSRVAAFFGVSFIPEMLAYDEGSTYSAPDISLIEQWKRKQSAQELSHVEHRVGALLTARGYTPSGHAPQEPTGMTRLRLEWQHKSSVWKTRVKRFGFVDPLIIRVARTLGLPQLGYAAQRRIDRKTLAILK